MWIGGGAGGPSPGQTEDRDPIEVKKEKALRGKKRIAWKEGRREKEKRRNEE